MRNIIGKPNKNIEEQDAETCWSTALQTFKH